jgi:hypothetical protein
MQCALQHKVHIYLEYHNVSPLVRIGTPPPTLLEAIVSPPKEPTGGRTHLGVRGWDGPNSDYWKKSLTLCLFCALQHVLYKVLAHCL